MKSVDRVDRYCLSAPSHLLYSALPRWNWSSAAFLLPVGVLPASVSRGH